MKLRQLLEFTVDASDPVGEVSAIISALLAIHPDKQSDILRGIDEQIGIALAGLETEVHDEAETEV